MSDLISRSKLIEEIGELLKSPYANQLQFGAERREAIETVRDLCVKKQHTAYDIDKVVKELKENSYTEVVDDTDPFGDIQHSVIRLDKATEIVKRAGVCGRCREAGGCPIRDDCPNDPYENVCEWKHFRNDKSPYRPSCSQYMKSKFEAFKIGDYCQFCGKKIKVVE